MDLRTDEEIVTAELCTEHHRYTYLQQVTHFRHSVEEIVVLGVVGQIGTLSLESVSRTGVQIAEVETCLKEEMTILEVIGKVNTCARATD